MADFLHEGWHWFVAVATLLGVVGCALFLKMQSTRRKPGAAAAELHGHTWDEDLAEYNNPLPRWWAWLFYLTILFSLGYFVVYPGLGAFNGTFGWSSTGEYQAEMKAAEATYGPMFDKYRAVDVATLAKTPEALAIGQRLFVNDCAQCHGSDAGGARGFPNLRDNDWLYGGDAATIEATILDGRNGVMPPLGAVVGGEAGIAELANYVRALSGLKHDAAKAAAGQAKFAVCAACHGADGRGNPAMGAPNLTDAVWLYGSSHESIAEGIRNGRNNTMPAQRERLGEARSRLLAAYVYSLRGPSK